MKLVDMKIERHLTAIHRRGLSSPIKQLFKLRLLRRNDRLTVLDYGCGHGEDVELLRKRGIKAWGYDPYFTPRGSRRKAHVVNLGFVLNTIPSQAERVRVLRDAWKYARLLMVVAVKREATQGRRYGDGRVTSRGTFQHDYDSTELEELLVRTFPGQVVERVADLMYIVYRIRGA